MEQKVRGLLAYLFGWIGGLVVLVAFKDNTKQTDFHACQAITLSVSYIVITIALIIISVILAIIIGTTGATGLGFISGIIGLVRWVLNIGYIILVVLGMVKAYHEEEYELPVISDLTRKVFKNKLA